MQATQTRPSETTPLDTRGQLDAALERLRRHNEKGAEKKLVEILIEGPRGTGKSRPFDAFIDECCQMFPGFKALVVRKTLNSLKDSFCKTFEEDVLTAKGRRILCGDSDRTNRTHYQYPNGSRIVLQGLDKPSKHQSTDWDLIAIEEGEEVLWAQIQGFFGALRNWTPGLRWQLFAVLMNPGPPRHWCNVRAKPGPNGEPPKMFRVVTRHRDNPKWFDWDRATDTYTIRDEGTAFMGSLSRYTGVQKARHVDGIWKGAEGLVWDNYDELTHFVPFEADPIKAFGLVEFRIGVDFGRAEPGWIGVLGIDARQRGVVVAQVYQTQKTVDWWARTACKLAREFHVERMPCDPSGPISTFNEWLNREGLGNVAYGANNKRASSPGGDLGGIDLVRWGFEKDNEGVPRLRIMAGSLREGVDQALLDGNKPTCLEEEIPSYAFKRDQLGEFTGDQTDSACADHGCDGLRYLAMDLWHVEAKKKAEPPPVLHPFSYGALCGTLEGLDAAQRKAHSDPWDDGI